MVTVKFFGVMRLNTGMAEMRAEAASVKELFEAVAATGKISRKDLKDCLVVVNGEDASRRTKLSDGDVVMLMSPAGGG